MKNHQITTQEKNRAEEIAATVARLPEHTQEKLYYLVIELAGRQTITNGEVTEHAACQ